MMRAGEKQKKKLRAKLETQIELADNDDQTTNSKHAIICAPRHKRVFHSGAHNSFKRISYLIKSRTKH